jgi:hypothetical protein
MRRARDGGSNDFHMNDIPKNRARWALALAANTYFMKKQNSTDKQRSEDAGRLACTRTGECACCGTPAGQVSGLQRTTLHAANANVGREHIQSG